MKFLGLITLFIFIFVLFSVRAATKKDVKSVLISAGETDTSHFLRHRKTGPQLPSALVLKTRAAAKNNTYCVCDDSPVFKLTVFCNGGNGLSAVINDSSTIAIITDNLNNLLLLLNGETGVGILLDYPSNTVYQLDDIWKASKEPFSQYFEGLTSLKPILQTAKRKGGGTSITNPSKSIKAEINADLTNLGLGSLQPKELINLIGKKITTQLRGPLKVLYKEKGAFEVHQDLGTFVKLNLALGEWLANGDHLDSIGPLDPGYIFSGKTGIGAFINLLEQIGDRADFSKVFGRLLNNHPKVLRLIKNIEKAVSLDGVDGFDGVMIEIIELLTGTGSLKDTIASLISYSPTLEVNPSVIGGYILQGQRVFDKQVKKYNNQKSVGWLREIFIRKGDNTFVVGNVNMTDLATVLYFRNFREVFSATARILIGLLSPQNIPNLIRGILNDIDVQKFISQLIPGLSGHISVDGILSFISRIPIVGWLIPKVLELVSNITNTLNQSASTDFKVVLDELASGSLTTATTNLFREIVGNILNFVSEVLEHFGIRIGNPLNAISGIISGLGGGVSDSEPTLLGGLQSKDSGILVHSTWKGKTPSVGFNVRF